MPLLPLNHTTHTHMPATTEDDHRHQSILSWTVLVKHTILIMVTLVSHHRQRPTRPEGTVGRGPCAVQGRKAGMLSVLNALIHHKKRSRDCSKARPGATLRSGSMAHRALKAPSAPGLETDVEQRKSRSDQGQCKGLLQGCHTFSLGLRHMQGKLRRVPRLKHPSKSTCPSLQTN